ncbi:actin binding Rho activating protein b [Syngnathus typhle]
MMSNQPKDPASLWKASSKKNIKKLRAISTVCGLAKSWQQWISENEKKQAAEPSGWCPTQGDSAEESQKTWTDKKSISSQKTEDVLSHVVASKGLSDPPDLPEDRTQIENNSEVAMITSSMKMTLVKMNVTDGHQNRSLGVKLLTKRSEKGGSGEDAEKFLETKSSSTFHTKSSDVVLPLVPTEIQVENEQEPAKEDDLKQEQNLDPKEDSGLSELGKETLNIDDEAPPSSSRKVCDEESTVKIKRPQIASLGKEAVDANKINALSKKYSPVGNLKRRWQNWASEHTENQKLNPFSENFDYEYSMSLRLQKGQDGYGRPKEGTKTAERAKRAEKHIHGEISDMCYVIRTMANPDRDGKTRVTFGELFDRYVRISDKVVGILMRARKHVKVHFEGEMLWQGQDDGVIITLLV